MFEKDYKAQRKIEQENTVHGEDELKPNMLNLMIVENSRRPVKKIYISLKRMPRMKLKVVLIISKFSDDFLDKNITTLKQLLNIFSIVQNSASS
ncbi:hypothetical protein BpHYR1_020406 [Brachionus plicatilis]|uniref:Uncharacterized protein n=1 Tax=Brachionus plicatilis TaxID=10195 RepID=A0A3M7R6U2_BRAPC|nr:hypothetical protein BpHYR1_020406 [Brachionus plicatilis]